MVGEVTDDVAAWSKIAFATQWRVDRHTEGKRRCFILTLLL